MFVEAKYRFILKKVENYIKKRARQLNFLYNIDIDDCIQELQIAVWESAKSYNSYYEVKDITYAFNMIKKRICNIIRDHFKNINNYSSFEFEDNYSESVHNNYRDIYDLIEIRHTFEIISNKLKSVNELAYKLFNLIAYGYVRNRNQACKYLDITKSYGQKLWDSQIVPTIKTVFESL